LRYYGRLKSVPRARLEGAIDFWLPRMQLADRAMLRIESLSKGQAQKVQFISAVVSEPELLILDEPFSGLDPVNAEALKDAVLSLRDRGTTIVFSTHDMSTAERLCDRIFMIFRGKKVLDGTLAEIQEQYGADTIRVRTDGGRAALDGMPGVDKVVDQGNLQEVRVTGDPQAFLRALVSRTKVHQFEIARPSLHDIFVRIAQPEAQS
jgi:ABC-2 type transport system ATP-binding protein